MPGSDTTPVHLAQHAQPASGRFAPCRIVATQAHQVARGRVRRVTRQLAAHERHTEREQGRERGSADAAAIWVATAERRRHGTSGKLGARAYAGEEVECQTMRPSVARPRAVRWTAVLLGGIQACGKFLRNMTSDIPITFPRYAPNVFSHWP